MADLSLTSMTPDQLRLEVDRLQRELDQTSSEKIQSAQYGLVLLEEKEQLEIRCEELETLYDTTKNELDVTQEALAKFQSNQQVSMHILKWNSLSYFNYFIEFHIPIMIVISILQFEGIDKNRYRA